MQTEGHVPLPLSDRDRVTLPSGLVVPCYDHVPSAVLTRMVWIPERFWVDRRYSASPTAGESCRRLLEMGLLLCTCWQVKDYYGRPFVIWSADCRVHPIFAAIKATYFDDAKSYALPEPSIFDLWDRATAADVWFGVDYGVPYR